MLLNFSESLAVFGKVTLDGLMYETNHTVPNSSAWNTVLARLEGAYLDAGIIVNESIEILEIQNDTEATVHFRIDVQNTTGYDISSPSFKNTTKFNLNGKHFAFIPNLIF